MAWTAAASARGVEVAAWSACLSRPGPPTCIVRVWQAVRAPWVQRMGEDGRCALRECRDRSNLQTSRPLCGAGDGRELSSVRQAVGHQECAGQAIGPTTAILATQQRADRHQGTQARAAAPQLPAMSPCALSARLPAVGRSAQHRQICRTLQQSAATVLRPPAGLPLLSRRTSGGGGSSPAHRRQRALPVLAARGGAAKAAAAAAAAAAAQQQTLVSQLFAASTAYALVVAALVRGRGGGAPPIGPPV